MVTIAKLQMKPLPRCQVQRCGRRVHAAVTVAMFGVSKLVSKLVCVCWKHSQQGLLVLDEHGRVHAAREPKPRKPWQMTDEDILADLMVMGGRLTDAEAEHLRAIRQVANARAFATFTGRR